MPLARMKTMPSSGIVLAGVGRAVVKVALCAAPVVFVAACGASTPTVTASVPDNPDVVVGAVPAESAAALYIAQERGIFGAHGLHVTIKTISTTSNVIPDMLHGTIDVASGQFPSFIAAQAAGLGRFHVLASGLSLGPGVNEILTMPSSGIVAAAGLGDATIAVNALAGDGPLLVYSLLSTYGIRPNRVHLKELPFSAMGAELAGHQIQAAYCTEPYCTEIEQRYGARVIADTDQGEARGLPIAGYTVTNSWMRQHPRTAAAFAASIAAASLVAETDVAALQHALVVSMHISPQIADVISTGDFPTTVVPADLQEVADLMLQFGELKHYFNVAVLTRSLQAA
jgi:NitT/TauT family transport system substrate-binding protein